MKITIESCVEGAEKAKGIAVIFDIFRASNTILALLASGAKDIIPVNSVECAIAIKKLLPDYILAGEEKGLKPEGFDYGNSPCEASQLDVNGKRVVFRTSAGTQGIVNAKNADEILIGSFANATALLRYIKRKKPERVSLVPIGLNGYEKAEEDELCAKFIEQKLLGEKPKFDQIKQQLLNCKGADRLRSLNQENDLEFCTQLNTSSIVPRVDSQGYNKITRHNIKRLKTAEEYMEEWSKENYFETNFTNGLLYKKSATFWAKASKATHVPEIYEILFECFFDFLSKKHPDYKTRFFLRNNVFQASGRANKTLAGMIKQGPILDIGCGITLLYDYLDKNLKEDYWGIDIAHPLFEFASAPAEHLLKCDFRNIGEAARLSKTYSVIVDCLTSKNFAKWPKNMPINNPAKYLNTIHSLLNENGKYFFVSKKESLKYDNSMWTAEEKQIDGYSLTILQKSQQK